MPYKPAVLVIDDEARFREIVQHQLQRLGCRVVPAEDGRAALAKVRSRRFDIVFLDYMLPDTDGPTLLKQLKELCPDTNVVMLTALDKVPLAVACIKAGADDYLTKPFKAEQLKAVVLRIIDAKRASFLPVESDTRVLHRYESLVGVSTATVRLRHLVDELASHATPVLIHGETGTGKELVARLIHRASPLADKPFVPVSIAALSRNLIESELFGHVAGAFTDAKDGKEGIFRSADGGVVFLDEVSEIPLDAQVKLLRVVEEGEVRPVGGDRPFSVTVRIIAATNHALESLVQRGAFRQDLYYRLNVLSAPVPSLRERREDIPILVDHFMGILNLAHGQQRYLSVEASKILMQHDWPGNVRELQNVITQAYRTAAGDAVDAPMLKSILEGRGPVDTPTTIRDYERQALLQALEKSGGDRSRAAKLLGIAKSTLYRKLRRYGMM